MSNSEFNLDDLELHFLPAWAQEKDTNRYANYSGESPRGRRGGPRDRDRGPGGRSGGGGRGGERRPQGPRQGGGRPGGQGQGGQRPQGQRPQGQGGRNRNDRGRQDRPQQRREPLPQIDLNVTFKPDAKGVESLSRQIRMTGRAYPLFDIAQMILRKPERHSVTLSVQKKPDGTPAQRLFTCALDDTPHLSEDDAIRHIMARHFQTFYQPEKTQIDAPKGTYTFVAQCGMSGTVLGPPNHHDYQNQLRKLHNARFSRMPFEAYKARVKIVKDEEVVKKWIEDQSWTTEYICLNMPEPLKLGSREEVEKHFRETHLANIVKEVETFTLSGAACKDLKGGPLTQLIRGAWEDQKRFPLQIATVLSQQFAAQGLQFFKVNKTVTHVAVARPHYLDLEAEPVSDGVKRIVQHVEAHPKCTRKQLVSALLGRPATEAPKPKPAKPAEPSPAAPTPQPKPTPEASTTETPASTEAAKTENAPAPEAKDAATDSAATPAPQEAKAESPAPTPEPEPAPPPELSPEETAIVADLHWVIHQGHVIEFANGQLETAKKPLPRPEKKKKKSPAPAKTESKESKESTDAKESKDPKASPGADPTKPDTAAAATTAATAPTPEKTNTPAAEPEPNTPAPTPAPEAQAAPESPAPKAEEPKPTPEPKAETADAPQTTSEPPQATAAPAAEPQADSPSPTEKGSQDAAAEGTPEKKE